MTSTIDVGDRVKIRDEIVAGEEPVEMGPLILVEKGWPNKFEVIAVVEHKGETLLALEECCKKRTNPATGAYTCYGHLSSDFKRIDPTKHPKDRSRPADRHMILSSPWGDVVKVEYFEDESPAIQMQLGNGKPVSLSGKAARALKKQLDEWGIL